MKKHCSAKRTWKFHCYENQAFGAKNYDPRKLTSGSCCLNLYKRCRYLLYLPVSAKNSRFLRCFGAWIGSGLRK